MQEPLTHPAPGDPFPEVTAVLLGTGMDDTYIWSVWMKLGSPDVVGGEIPVSMSPSQAVLIGDALAAAGRACMAKSN